MSSEQRNTVHIQRQPIITSLLDTDLYKLTMLQAFYHAPEFVGIEAEWKFNCRNSDRDLTLLLPELEWQLQELCTLRFLEEELHYLSTFTFFKPDFLNYLRNFQFDRSYITLRPLADGEIDLRIKGPLLQVSLFEVPTLAIISELNSFLLEGGIDLQEGRTRLSAKLQLLNAGDDLQGVQVADFSTRRRASKAWQYEMVELFQQTAPQHLAGTSNLFLARRLGISPIGTMAHEWMQAWQAVVPLAGAQRDALNAWVREFQGQLGIALTDNYNMAAFCRDFNCDHAESFSGLRHDSGDPIDWGEQAIALYRNCGIDPIERTLIFSDSLNFPRMIEIYRHFNGRTKVSFGIGTDLGNDVGITPLNIVLKMIRANGQPVAKVSDAPGKSMCEDARYLLKVANAYQLDLKPE
jgi:nicotinate phosphoribosyltransferase